MTPPRAGPRKLTRRCLPAVQTAGERDTLCFTRYALRAGSTGPAVRAACNDIKAHFQIENRSRVHSLPRLTALAAAAGVGRDTEGPLFSVRVFNGRISGERCTQQSFIGKWHFVSEGDRKPLLIFGRSFYSSLVSL